MFLVTVGAIYDKENIKKNLYTSLEELGKEGFDILLEDYEMGGSCIIKCGIKDTILTRLTDKNSQEEFKYRLSLILTEVILSSWESRLIKKIIKDNYFYLTEKEKGCVGNITARLLKEEKMMQPGGFYKATRRSKLTKALMEYLESETNINIDGYVNFRLSAYIADLNEAVERALEVYVAEREYNEFIRLLKYFVEIQECKVDVIHLKQAEDGGYLITDGFGGRISSEYFDELRAEIADESINFDDLLISTLITISPRKMIIHDIEGFKNKELVQTIMNVFGERISVCTQCELCKKQNATKETNKYGL